MSLSENNKWSVKLSTADKKILRTYADIYTETGSRPEVVVSSHKKTSNAGSFQITMKRG